MSNRYVALGVDDGPGCLHVWDRRADIAIALHHSAESGRVRRYRLDHQTQTIERYIDSVDSTLGWAQRDNDVVEISGSLVKRSANVIRGGQA